MASIQLPKPGQPFVILSPGTGDGNSTLTDLSDEFIRDLYTSHGAIIFRGFDVNLKSFTDLIERFCTHSSFNEAKGR